MIVFVVGKQLSGKSYYVKRFLAKTKKRFIVVDPLYEYSVDIRFHSMPEFENALPNKVNSSVGLTLAFDEDIQRLFALSWHLNEHILILEEFHQYANAWNVSKPLQRLFRMGRHRGIDIIGITQRFVDLPQIAVGQANAIIFFEQQGTRDLEAIERLSTTELAMKVKALHPHECIEYQFGQSK